MKKLMIALAAVAMAAGVQAAQWTWKVSSGDFVLNPGTTTSGASGQAYIFADLTETQFKAIVDDFAAGTYSPSGYEVPATLASGVFSGSVTEDSDSRTQGQNVVWTMIVKSTIDGEDYLYISNPTEKARLADNKNQTVTFKEAATSMLAAKDAAAGYAGAGWYTAVPEPTSGLLLLLGVGALALRRRRA